LAQKKKILTDVVWSVLALAVMHGVLQVVVYPYMNHRMGAERFGDVLYVLAILGILAPSVGLAANNTRLIQRKEMTVENGDYILAMAPQFVLSAVVFSVLVFRYASGVWDMLLALVTLLLTMLRNYGDVEYRMTLNYKGYFLYYLFVSIGYLLGALLFPLTQSWILTFLLGELFCCLLLLVRGHIYWPLTLTSNWKKAWKATLVLASSYLLFNTVLYLDRLLLQNLMNGEVVTVYYVASLLGKTAALLVGPLNGVIIGYLTKDEVQIKERQFMKAAGGVSVAGALLYGAILLVTPIFTRVFYPEIADAVMEIAWIANLSQILCFIASPLMTVMLTFSKAKWQLIIQSIYALEFVLLSVAGVWSGGLHGFVWAGLAANLIRFVLVFAVGLMQARKQCVSTKVM